MVYRPVACGTVYATETDMQVLWRPALQLTRSYGGLMDPVQWALKGAWSVKNARQILVHKQVFMHINIINIQEGACDSTQYSSAHAGVQGSHATLLTSHPPTYPHLQLHFA